MKNYNIYNYNFLDFIRNNYNLINNSDNNTIQNYISQHFNH